MKKKILYFVLGLIILVALVLVGNIVLYRLTSLKVEPQGQFTKYTDNKFGYSFIYPNSWKKSNGGATNQGYVDITSDKAELLQLQFWYKDSGKINNLDDLVNFVKDDAKYDEGQNHSQTESIEKTTLNGRDVVLWKVKVPKSDNHFFYEKVYYIADFKPLSDQQIFIWTIAIATKDRTEPTDMESVNKILSSYTIFK